MSETPENPVLPDPADEQVEPPAAAAPARGRRPSVFVVLVFGVALVVLAADQLSKVWAQGALVAGEAARPLVGDVIGLRLIYNSGAALSFGSGMTWVLTLLSALVVAYIVMTARRIRSAAWAASLGLVLGGALGNLGDRLFRAPGFPEGHVVDFIDYGPFIGNVADIAIVVAAVAIGILAFAGHGPDGERVGGGEDTTAKDDVVQAGAVEDGQDAAVETERDADTAGDDERAS